MALYKSERIDEAIAELRRALADAPDLQDDTQIAVVLRRITAHRTLAAWLAERSSQGGTLAKSDQEEGTRLYESALELLDSVFPDDQEEPIEEDPDFKPKQQSLADALRMEVTRVRFALLLQLVRLHAATGKGAKAQLELHGRRLFDQAFIAKAEKMGAAAPTEEFTDARTAWRASLFRIGAEVFTKVGSDEAAQRWRDVLDICKSRERDVHMQMGIAKPTAEMRGQTVDALVGLAAALHPPWKHLPVGVFAEDGSFDPQRFESSLDEIENSLREALEIIEQVGDAEMVASNTLSSVMLAKTLRTPVASAEDSTAGRGVGFLTNYPARAREFAKLMHGGLLSATSVLGEIPTVPAEAFNNARSDGSMGTDAQLSGNLTEEDQDEDFGDPRHWSQLSTEEQSAAQRLGWTAQTWDDGGWLDEEDGSGNCVSWDALAASSRADAELLGFDQREWDLCYYANEDESCDHEQAGQPTAALENQAQSAQWAVLHSVDRSTAALALLPGEHRRVIELAIDCALEQLLVVAAEIAEEAAERYASHAISSHLFAQAFRRALEPASCTRPTIVDSLLWLTTALTHVALLSRDAVLQHGGDDNGLQYAEARVRWWGLLEPTCLALVPATAQRHGGRSEAMATALSVLAKAKEETGQTDAAVQLYERVGRARWDGGAATCRRIQLGAKFEIGRLHAGRMDADGMQRAEQVFRREFESMLADRSGGSSVAVDPQLLALFASGLEAVLRSQGRAAEADAIGAQLAQSESSR